MKKFNPYITKEEIKELPLLQFPGEIYVVDDMVALDWAYNQMINEGCLGFDTETRPSFKKGRSYSLSLVQLSTEDKCYLIRINKIGFPERLVEIFENPKIIKIGFDLNSDFHQIRRKVKIDFQGFVDLQRYAKEFGLNNMSLKKLAAIVMNRRLSKRQRLSNWEQDELSEAQRIYAATDAWATLMIYKRLKEIEGQG